MDLWKDAEYFEKEKDTERSNLLFALYNARFIEGDFEKAESLKEDFQKIYGYWGKYW